MTGTNTADTRTLWAGILAGPVAWAVQLQVGYALAAPACGSGRLGPLHLTSPAALMAAGGGGLLAWRSWRQVGGWPSASDEATAGRVRLMSVLGMMSAALFAVMIVAQWTAMLMLPACPQ